MSFCGNCGNAVTDNARFCGGCGAPCMPAAGREPQPTQYDYHSFQISAAADQSRILDLLPQARIVTPAGPKDVYTLVFTQNQVIMAKLTGEIIKEAQQNSQVQGKAEGKGWLGRARDQMRATGAVHQRYLEMTPGQILSETIGNFGIDHAVMASVTIRPGHEFTNQDVPGDSYAEVILTFPGGSYELRLGMQIKDVAATLQKYYPGRVIVQR